MIKKEELERLQYYNIYNRTKPNLPEDRNGKLRVLVDSRAALGEGNSAIFI